MSLESKAQALSTDINRSHTEPANSDIQTNVLMRCMQLLLHDEVKTDPCAHFFCNPHLEPVAGHALIMFSFPGKKNKQSQIVESRFVDCLTHCKKCIRGFYKCLSEIRLRFVTIRKIPVGSVDQFIGIINDWLSKRISSSLSALAHDDLSELPNVVYECLCNPRLLRENDSINTFLRLFLTTHQLTPRELLPSLISFVVEGDDALVTYASKWLDSIDEAALALPSIDEFNHHFYRVQDAKYFTTHFCIRFWGMLHLLSTKTKKDEIKKLFKPADLEEMSSFTQVRLFPLPRVLFNNIMAQLDEPLPNLLKVTRQLLHLFGRNFWDVAEGCHFRNILDTILVNNHFHRRLKAALAANDTGAYDALLGWIMPFVDSLSGSQRQTACINLVNFFLNTKINVDASGTLSVSSILLKCFSLELLQKSKLDPTLLLRLRDARSVVSKHSQYFIDAARSNSLDSDLPTQALCTSIKYDILVAAYNSAQLQKAQQPTLVDTDLALWNSLTSIPLQSPRLIGKLLNLLSDAVSIIVFKPKKNDLLSKEIQASVKIHNRDCEKLCSAVSSLIDKFALADPDDLKQIASSAEGLFAMWSCILSPAINQSALNILYQVFDAEGRYEAICGLLDLSLPANLSAIVHSLDIISSLKAHEPCPKALRILMDVVNALVDPLTGILTANSDKAQNSKTEMQSLWSSSWELLMMIYQSTLVWAGMYHLEDLIEFTRDTLDVSHLLVDSFRPLLDYINDPAVKAPMFDSFMKTFHHVIVWLRLGDTSLLNSCVNLVFKGFDLAKDLEVPVDKTFIITFAKYGAKAKKFNNKLTEQQREEILGKASEFDANLVSFVIEEARKQRAGTSQSPTPPAASSREKSPADSGATYAYQTKPKQAKQLLLTRFGIMTNEPPVAPAPPKPFKANNLEAIRSELKSNRSPAPLKPAVNPAPARPAGFNQKRAPAVGRSLNTLRKKADSDSSDESDDDDIDTSDLFLESKKKTKIIELDIHGKPVTKTAQNKKVNQERREEERMRLRLNVNLKPLYLTILKWNYNNNSEFPTEERDIYQPVKDLYSDVKEYVKVVEPLLMLECWQGIQSLRTTGQETPFELLVGSRTTCDGFFDVYASIKKAELQARKIGETDLLVLGYVADKGYTHPNDVAEYLKEPGTQTCLAKVRDIKHANADYCDITFRVYPLGSMMGLLTPKTLITGMKIMQMVTVEREYSSLKGLQYYDLCDEILEAKPTKPLLISSDESKRMCEMYNVNSSQARAIVGSSINEGFSLIQGPPGTGKTKTILGIVGHFLSSVQKSNIVKVPPTNPARGGTPDEGKRGPKVLVCAPSNAAVDELLVRIREGVLNSKGETIHPNVVRLGRGDAINQAVRDLSLEELIDRQLNVKNNSVNIDPNIRSEHTKCIAERDRIRAELRKEGLDEKEVVSLETKLREINKKRSELGKRLDEQRESASIAYRTREIERKQLQAKILSEAQIICSTLSGSAHDFLASMSMKFDQVIIDEACQCVELSAIIPLRYGCKKCIMVGDPNQLPPTVLSQKAASFNYEESLFVRMQRSNPESVYLLDVQYRMHPEISRFPSAQFYRSKLADGQGMLAKNTRPWHQTYPMTPYRFFDIVSRHQQNERSRSFFNAQEARVALELVEKLMDVLPSDDFKGRIGIISPYKEQIRSLRDVFQRKFGSTILNEIDFNTVDGFQGQEKEIIIMSCVRASETGSVGFLSDIRRMNVALTRARTTLWILGNKASLRRDKVWNKLISDAENRNCVTNAEPGFLKRVMAPASSMKSQETSASRNEAPEKELLDRAQESSPDPTKLPESGDNSSNKKEPKTNAHNNGGNRSDKNDSKNNGKGNNKRIGGDDQTGPSHKKIKAHKSGVYIHNPKKEAKSGSNQDSASKAGAGDSGGPGGNATQAELVDARGKSGLPPPPAASKSGVYRPPNGMPRRPAADNIFIRRRGKK